MWTWFERWFDVPDNVPHRADAIFCPTYSVTPDGKALTPMSAMCAVEGGRMLHELRAPVLIISNYKFSPWSEEYKWKCSLLGNWIDDSVIGLRDVLDTSDEVQKAKEQLWARGAKSVIVVAERRHMKRILRCFRLIAPDIKLYSKSFTCRKFVGQCHHLPFIGNLALKNEFFWAAWNFVFYYLTPVIFAIRRRKAQSIHAS